MRSALFLERGPLPHFRRRPFISISIQGGFGARGAWRPQLLLFRFIHQMAQRRRTGRTKGRSRSVGRTRKDLYENEIFLGLFSIFMGETRVTRTSILRSFLRLQSSQSSSCATSILATLGESGFIFASSNVDFVGETVN